MRFLHLLPHFPISRSSQEDTMIWWNPALKQHTEYKLKPPKLNTYSIPPCFVWIGNKHNSSFSMFKAKFHKAIPFFLFTFYLAIFFKWATSFPVPLGWGSHSTWKRLRKTKNHCSCLLFISAYFFLSIFFKNVFKVIHTKSLLLLPFLYLARLFSVHLL